MLRLHTMVPAFGLPTFTPFGLKVIAYLRLADLPFELQIEHDPGRGPQGKLPWLVDGERVVPDSAFILRYLDEKHDVQLDAWLTLTQRAQAHSIRRMVEEGLCFSVLYTRWLDDDVCKASTDILLAPVPQPVRALVRNLVRRRIVRDLKGQGIARHGREGAAQIAWSDLQALSTLLGESLYMMGERPSQVDASVAAFLAVILAAPFDTTVRRAARGFPNLVSYYGRMHAQCFAQK